MRSYSSVSLASGLLIGLLFLSFFGAVAFSHTSGHSTGCLATDLLQRDCPAGVSGAAQAIFHSEAFLSLFRILLVPLVVLGFLLVVRIFSPPRFLPGRPRIVIRPIVAFQSSRLKRRLDRWRSLIEHQPTLSLSRLAIAG